MDFENGSGKGQWPLYVEKAWAKVHGSQRKTIGGYPDETYAALFGAPVEIISHKYQSNAGTAHVKGSSYERKKKVLELRNGMGKQMWDAYTKQCVLEAFWEDPVFGLSEDSQTQVQSHPQQILQDLFKGGSQIHFKDKEQVNNHVT